MTNPKSVLGIDVSSGLDSTVYALFYDGHMLFTITSTELDQILHESPLRAGDRYRVPAVIRNGWFASEKQYRVRTTSGHDFTAIGFSRYFFNEQGWRLTDKEEWEGERHGYCEVIFLQQLNAHTVLVESPQLHGYAHTGPIAIAKSDLRVIDKRDWQYNNRYGT